AVSSPAFTSGLNMGWNVTRGVPRSTPRLACPARTRPGIRRPDATKRMVPLDHGRSRHGEGPLGSCHEVVDHPVGPRRVATAVAGPGRVPGISFCISRTATGKAERTKGPGALEGATRRGNCSGLRPGLLR